MNSYWIAVIIPILVQFLLFLPWLHRRLRDDEIQRAFVCELALIHLPYIYTALRRIAEHQGVNLPDPPQVHFVQMPNEGKRPRS
jgi:hypothetical protein